MATLVLVFCRRKGISVERGGSGERRGHRGHENGNALILQFLNNERGDEGFLNLDQRWLPHVLFILAHESLCQTPKERIAWRSFEEISLDSFPARSSFWRAGGNTD